LKTRKTKEEKRARDDQENRVPMNELTPILCHIKQAAAMLGRGERFIYEAIATGLIDAVKSNKRTLVVVESLHAYAAKLPRAVIKPMTRKRPQRSRRRTAREARTSATL
jgi:hypothetical protein